MSKTNDVKFEILNKKSTINDILIGCDLNHKLKTPDNKNLTLFAFIPIDKLIEYSPELKKEFDGLEYKNKVICVFTFYDEEDYFLDYITEIDDALNGYTKVIIADKNNIQFNLDNFYSINIIQNSEGMSFLGGNPKYLQEEGYNFKTEYIFIGQILGMDLPEPIEDLFYLPGNVGYIFIKKDLSGGLFFVQAT